jgi:hypothetical protein
MEIQFVWKSALPGAAGAHSGLLWLRYYIPRGTVSERRSDGMDGSYAWIIVALGLSLVFIFVLGNGFAASVDSARQMERGANTRSPRLDNELIIWRQIAWIARQLHASSFRAGMPCSP